MEVLLSVLLFYLFFAFLDRNIWKRKDISRKIQFTGIWY